MAYYWTTSAPPWYADHVTALHAAEACHCSGCDCVQDEQNTPLPATSHCPQQLCTLSVNTRLLLAAGHNAVTLDSTGDSRESSLSLVLQHRSLNRWQMFTKHVNTSDMQTCPHHGWDWSRKLHGALIIDYSSQNIDYWGSDTLPRPYITSEKQLNSILRTIITQQNLIRMF